jgi:hypothetical protein
MNEYQLLTLFEELSLVGGFLVRGNEDKTHERNAKTTED